jgi:predicted O-methyltransferase YrrM
MAQLAKFVRVVQRRKILVEEVQGFILPLIEPLFMIDTHLSFEERAHLFGLTTQLPQHFVACEIGSYLGSSTAFLAAAASYKHGHVHAVDTWQNDAMGPDEPVEDTWLRFLENTDRFRTWITPHRGWARDVKDRVPLVDMLFIDGDHSYEGTLENLQDFVPKLKPRAVVAMHDFDYASVTAAMKDYFKDREIEDLGLVQRLKGFRPL